MTEEQYLTITEVSKLVRVSRRTVYNWLSQGLVKSVRTPSGSVRIARSSLYKEETKYKQLPSV